MSACLHCGAGLLPVMAAFACAAGPFDDAVKAGEQMPRLHSLLVSQRGEVILGHYFHGARANNDANVKPASKSVISALVGIAIDRRLLPGVDAPIAPYFPELAAPNADARKRKITIEDLLTMRSGLVDTNRGYGAWVRSSNWVHYLLAHSMQGPPGEQMNYNTGNTHLLSAMLTKVSGGDTWTFAEKALAAPLGITLLNAAAILRRTPLNAPETLNCFPFGPFRTPSGCGIADPGRRRWAATMSTPNRNVLFSAK